MSILIVDDEIEVASLLADAVKSQGHEVMVAHDGEEGLALLRQFRPEAVFLDVQMPEMSGIELLRRIRRTDPTLPVVLITGHAATAELEEARQLGVTAIIQKPDILTRLREALDGLSLRA